MHQEPCRRRVLPMVVVIPVLVLLQPGGQPWKLRLFRMSATASFVRVTIFTTRLRRRIVWCRRAAAETKLVIVSADTVVSHSHCPGRRYWFLRPSDGSGGDPELPPASQLPQYMDCDVSARDWGGNGDGLSSRRLAAVEGLGPLGSCYDLAAS
uniref:(northern house mosquito) hypothetical protein n=1 Tax=Culex pipiens TaxID=7175 RepID=A0A8D8BIP7_CULPI